MYPYADTGTKEVHGYAKAKKKNCYVALSRPTVKCEKTGSGFFFFFFFFMSDLGEEFAKICIQPSILKSLRRRLGLK